MNYDELVCFVEWMKKRGCKQKEYTPYVAVDRKGEDDQVENRIHFDGVITQDDVQRFNAEPTEEGR